MNENVTIIAEGEINHNGDVELAKHMVRAAKEAGVDSIKFQCFVADAFNAPTSAQRDIFKSNELTLDDFHLIRDEARAAGIEMLSTATDLEGLQMIVDLDLPVIKIGSTNITNTPLLTAIAETSKPVYLSTGAATLAEIDEALNILSKSSANVAIFHCTIQYPAEDHLLNLKVIPTLISVFPGVPVGYSDHSIGSTAAVAAVSLGATMLEKHFTLDNEMPGPDHWFSINPTDLAKYVQAVRRTEVMLGSARKAPLAEEMEARRTGRRFVTAMTDIPEGTVIEPAMIRPRRIGETEVDEALLLPPRFEKEIIGWRVRRTINDGSAITWRDIVPVG